MSQQSDSPVESLIPPQPLPEGAVDFARRVHGLMDGQPKDEATVAEVLDGMDDMFEKIAAGMYTLASMLVGEGEDGVSLVETAVANAEVAPCSSALQARKNSRHALCSAAIEMIARRDPASLAAPEETEGPGSCIEEDDLKSAGVTSEELEQMMAGPDRDRVRTWLESLATNLRIVFVIRAVAGFCSEETAQLLATHGGPQAAGWTPGAVRDCFRQALCSLASQLLHDSTAH